MDDKISQFLKKIEELPEEVSLYFSSPPSAYACRDLVSTYDIVRDDLDEVIYDFFISDFQTGLLPKLISDNIKNIPEDKVNNFISDFLGKLFFPVELFIKKDISSAIKKYKGKIDDYKEYIEKFNDLVDDKNLDNLSEVLEDLDKNFSPKEEEALVSYILEKDLMNVYRDSDISGPRKINGSLIYLLINKKDSLNKFIKAFMNNQEKLGSKKIILSGKEQEPTIANWIKHFISEQGSESFSNIVLAKYLTSSAIKDLLNENDRKILRKILKTYRNLSFFPDSMNNVPFENWEIIPIEKDLDLSEEKDKMAFRKTREVEDVSSPKEELKEKEIKSEKVLESKALPINLGDQELDVLQEMLKKYPNKSLERKAIESEIKKRKK
jgi:hypothetical protein